MATRRRSTTTAEPGAGQELTNELRAALPPRFEAVGEALASGSGTVVACEVLGGTLARDGISLAEALDDLARTWDLVQGVVPPYAESRALAVAWSEATLGYVHGLSCEDPLTGLGSLAHLCTVIGDLRRGGPVHETHALVVVAADVAHGARVYGEPLARAMDDAQLGATVRGVFAGVETIGHLAPGRLAVLARRDELLLRRFDLLLRMIDAGDPPRPRAWIEGLPETDESVVALLDELTRS
ncbi:MULTISPECIES: hypothetical protein [unclassified Nocardioides]|uniref:hypothetical protein n=1 Tax=unclassified Nocardioides TaxID=2615069 RepID=UPI00362100BE